MTEHIFQVAVQNHDLGASLVTQDIYNGIRIMAFIILLNELSSLISMQVCIC